MVTGACVKSSGDFLTPSPPAEKASTRQDQPGRPAPAMKSGRVLIGPCYKILPVKKRWAASNAQYDQRYKSDADEQHYERDGVVFEPMPITGKHHVTATPIGSAAAAATSIGLTKQPCQLLFLDKRTEM
jgi:hypothetical protein